MANRNMIMSNLIKNSMSAYYAAIEIHNKPNISYRYETVTLLICNAWELILKAFIRKYIKTISIFTKDGHTISLDNAIRHVNEYINSIKPKSFLAIKENVEMIERYRNGIVHFYNDKLNPYIFMLVAKSSLNYVDFVRRYFNKDVMDIDGLFIMPLGFKLPFKPEDFLSKKAVEYNSTKESKSFINSIIKCIQDLDSQNIDDSIVIGFDIFFESVKKNTNSDILAAITELDQAEVTFAKITNVNLTSDPNAQVLKLSDEEFRRIWKYNYQELTEYCRINIPNFKQNKQFIEFKKIIEGDIKNAYTRKLDSNNAKSPSKTFYTENALNALSKLYSDLLT